MPRRSVVRGVLLGSGLLLIASLHFSLGTATHPLHVAHVALGVLALGPILAAAIWYGLPGGVLSSALFAIMYAVHMRVNWSNQPMENTNQIAMITVYLLVGSVAGILEDLQGRERNRRLAVQESAQREAIIQGLASLDRALGSRDRGTLRHSENVAWLAVALARRIGLTEERIETLRLAALVHDIGKIGIRDDVLLKPARLTAEEYEEIQRHPRLAAEILLAIHGTEQIAEIVLAHHERLDGQGYPRGLKDPEIPIEAKVLSVADVYCALTEARPYNRTRLLGANEALSLIKSMAGSALDRRVVDELAGLITSKRASSCANPASEPPAPAPFGGVSLPVRGPAAFDRP